MKRLYQPLSVSILFIIGFWSIFEICSRWFAEILWFKEVDYLSAFLIRRGSECTLWLLICIITSLFLGWNLWLASRWQWQWRSKEEWYDAGISYTSVPKQFVTQNSPKITLGKQFPIRPDSEQKISSPRLKLPLLLLAATAAAVALTYILLHSTQVALSVWETSYRLPKIASRIKPPLDIFDLDNLTNFVLSYLRQLGIVVVIVPLLLWKPQISLKISVVLVGIIFGFIWAGNWAIVLRFLHPSGFNLVDPQFHKDIGFYIFRLPLWQLLKSWLIEVYCYALISCTLFYLLSGNSLSEGRFPGFSRPQLRHLSILGSGVMLSLANQHWLNRFELLYNSSGVVYGAGYTNIKVQLTIEICLTIVAVLSAIWLIYKGFTGYQNLKVKKRKIKRIIWLILPFMVYLFVFSLSNFSSTTIQHLLVQPNELVKERPYIERNIAMTRRAFNLDNIEAKTFNPQGVLTAEDLKNNNLTIKNIRLWDTRPILKN